MHTQDCVLYTHISNLMVWRILFWLTLKSVLICIMYMYIYTKTSIIRTSKRTLFGTVRRWINSSPGNGLTKNNSESRSWSVCRASSWHTYMYAYINTLTRINPPLIHPPAHQYLHSFTQVTIAEDDLPLFDLPQSRVFQQTKGKEALSKHRLICNAL